MSRLDALSDRIVTALAVLVIAAIAFGLVGCSPANLERVKSKAEAKWREVGYVPIGYEGFQWGFWGFGGYGGAQVWYSLRREPDNGIIYSGSLQQWGDEIHVYGPRAIDAIKP